MARQFDVTLLSIHLITLLKAFSLRSSPTSLGIYNLDGKASQEVRNQLLGGKYCVVSTKDLHIVIMPQGKCLCGAVEYTIDVPESELVNGGIGCHCNDCKTAGSASSHNLKIDTDKINITKGQPKKFTGTGSSGKPVHRFFCGDCGTPVWTNAESMAGSSFVKVGALGDFSNRVKMTAEAWAENANPNTLRPHVKHLDASFQPIEVQV